MPMSIIGVESLKQVVTVFDVYGIFLMATAGEKLADANSNRKRVITRGLIFLPQVLDSLDVLTSPNVSPVNACKRRRRDGF